MKSNSAKSQAALLPHKLAFRSVISVSQSKAAPIKDVSRGLAGNGIRLYAWNGHSCQLQILRSKGRTGGRKKRRENWAAYDPELVFCCLLQRDGRLETEADGKEIHKTTKNSSG